MSISLTGAVPHAQPLQEFVLRSDILSMAYVGKRHANLLQHLPLAAPKHGNFVCPIPKSCCPTYR